MSDYSFFAAMLVGLLGGGHCFGMCGGIVGAFSQGLPASQRLTLQGRLRFTLSYNLGRISSYVLAGLLVGASSAALTTISQLDSLISLLQLAAAVMLMLMGLYLGQWFYGLVVIEKLGRPWWRLLTPIRTKLGTVDRPAKAVAAGMIWGWLPCGLVYSTLTWALASGNPLDGALIMFGFGLGTLPALFAMGAATDSLATLIQHKNVKKISAIVLIAYAIQMAYIALHQLL
ncbi:sulfite exporter TauE/SafE family protein [Ferrimonas senticii]|uniref:sulfite exporter TauE/SafE family protein n=1 Tax=Ferrimonas senticii TaxID=394566 RepID=UPI0003F65C43|nr:sulfite exporter TauE/SafE family protein [Ferrimonas senticii]